jgi:hypothetical protein
VWGVVWTLNLEDLPHLDTWDCYTQLFMEALNIGDCRYYSGV